MGGWTKDVRLAWRRLGRAPGFAAAVVLVLGLGIGANATVYGALRAAILAEPPYPEPERLVFADLTYTPEAGETRPSPWSFPKFRVFDAADGRLIDPAAGYGTRSVTLSGVGPPARIDVEVVTPGYFEVLGVGPLRGRAFTDDEADPADPPLVTVLSHALWQGAFGGDADILDREVTFNGRRMRVVGVAPPGFAGLGGGAQAWIPVAAAGELVSRFMVTGSQAHWMRVVGRLRPGATFAEAEAQMAVLGGAVSEAYPTRDGATRYGATARPFDEVRTNEDARAAVLLLSLAAGLVLLVACANVSGLLLARARARARDGAVRLAMGASRWRIVRASLVESGLLAALGGGLGLVLAAWGTRAMARAWPEQFLRSARGEMQAVALDSLTVDVAVLVFGAAVALLTVALVGLVPALRASRAELAADLRQGAGASRRSERILGLDVRGVLVAAQVGLAVVLLVGTGLVGVSMSRLLAVDPGFDPDGLLTFSYTIARESAWGDDPVGFQEAMVERLTALPGVESAAVGVPPFGGHWSITGVNEVEGRGAPAEPISIGVGMVSPNYFEVLGIPLLDGRPFHDDDGRDAAASVILNRLAAERIFGGERAVGRRIELGIRADGKERLAEVVGVVGDALYSPPDEDPIPEAYYAAREFPVGDNGVVVRTASDDPLELVPAVRAALHELDAPTPMYSVLSMDDRIRAATGDRRAVLGLLGLFAALTLLLAATATWAVVSYAVADRRRELGLRLALGAGAGRVVRQVLGGSVRAGALGLAAGIAGAWAGARLLDAFLFRTSTRDPLAFAGGAAVLALVVLLASWLPARRATRVDPVEVLRAD